MVKNALVFLTVIPDDEIIENAYKLCQNYEVFILLDDNNFDLKKIHNFNIKYLQINDIDCINSNYINSGGCSGGFWSDDYKLWKKYNIKNPSAWDKALYYFCKLNIDKYNFVWFIEDDVLIPNIEILKNIDNTYLNSDFLSEASEINYNGDTNSWLWRHAENKFKLPWYKSMICACRMSNKLLREINNYVLENKMLMFDEIMFPTLAHHKKLIVHNPKELSGIKYWTKWEDEIDKDNIMNNNTLYHPVKKMDKKIYIKNKLLNLQIEMEGGYKLIKNRYLLKYTNMLNNDFYF